MKCTRCGERLGAEEIESPSVDKDGDIICDHCFEEQYTYNCPVCEEFFDEDFSQKISPKYLLISDYAGEEMGVESGIYEIISYPFFRDGMISMSMIETAINRIADLPEEFDENDFISDIFYVRDSCVKKCLEATK